MLSHLLLGQTAIRRDGFWRTPKRHGERRESLPTLVKGRARAQSKTPAADACESR